MKALVTLPCSLRNGRNGLFPADVRDRLAGIADEVVYNETSENFTSAELATHLADGVDACITGWGTRTLDGDVIADATDLRFVGHVGGSVGVVGSHALFDRGVTVTSANYLMAEYVAEGVLAYALAGLRDIPARDAAIKAGGWDPTTTSETLKDATVGFVGLGAVGSHLLDLLAPFDVDVNVYDPYIDRDALTDWSFATLVSEIDDALEGTTLVSVHASLTEETVGMLGGEELAALPDGALLVNCARGPIVDTDALVAELETGRIRAALDVYDEEPLPEDHPLRACPGTVLGPHAAGSPSRARLAAAVVADLERFVAGEAVHGRVSRSRYERMTDDSLR